MSENGQTRPPQPGTGALDGDVPVMPVPTNITCQPVQTADAEGNLGNVLILIRFSTPMGPQHYFFGPQQASQFAGYLQGVAQEVLAALAVETVQAGGGLVVASAGDDVETLRRIEEQRRAGH